MQKQHFSMRKHAFAAKMVDEKNAYLSPFCQGKSRFMAKYLEDKRFLPIFAA
jgi:hypothetical protein